MRPRQIVTAVLGIVALAYWLTSIVSELESTPTAQPTPIPQVLSETDSVSSPSSSPVIKEGVVFSRVIDGDTIEVSSNGAKIVVRIIGINTPETVDPRKEVECFGQEASDFAKNYFKSATELRLEADPSQARSDRYGRWLRYVFVDDKDYGLDAISHGYAYEYTYDGEYRYQATYKQAQQQAQATAQGLWGAGCD